LSAKRKFPLSAASALFCLVVIFIHIISPAITGADRSTVAYAAALSLWRLSAFVVQGFILLAGAKFGLKLKYGCLDLRKYYLSRAKRILVPYIIWVTVYYLGFWLQRYYEFSFFDLLRYMLVGDLAAHFYFVVTVLQFYALAPVWKAMASRLHAAVALPAAAFISLISAQYLPDLLALAGISNFAWSDRVFATYLVWWVAGLYIGRDWEAFAKSLERSRAILAAATLLFGLLDARIAYDMWVHGRWHAFAEPVHMLYSGCAVMLVLSLGTLLPEKSTVAAVLSEIDRSGYGIYLSHVLVLSATGAALDYFGITRLAYRIIISAAATYSVSLGANIGYRKLMAFIRAKIRPAEARTKS
jgi:hypothetical protein